MSKEPTLDQFAEAPRLRMQVAGPARRKPARRLRWVNRRPDRTLALFLALLPFALVLVNYCAASKARLSANPGDKLLPSAEALFAGFRRIALTPDARSGSFLMLTDTWASVSRLGEGLLLAAAVGLAFGLVLGLLPVAGALLGPFVTVPSMVPPLALLPILFITLGLGEASKVTLIVVGIARS